MTPIYFMSIATTRNKGFDHTPLNIQFMTIDIKIFPAIIKTMKNQDSKRSYQMSKRAESAAQTESAIFSATADLWREHPLAEITLDAIAERANVSVRTIIRKFGSRDELFNICIQNNSNNIESDRESAIHFLLKDYEAFGPAIIRTLAVEDQIEAAQKVLQAGRLYHRQWCARIFAPFLPAALHESYESELTAFVAATELYLWKLLRHDLSYDLIQTQQTFIRLVSSLVK